MRLWAMYSPTVTGAPFFIPKQTCNVHHILEQHSPSQSQWLYFFITEQT